MSRNWGNEQRAQIRRILNQPDFIDKYLPKDQQEILRSFIKGSKTQISNDERLILILILDKVVNIPEDDLAPDTIRRSITDLVPTLQTDESELPDESLLFELEEGEERGFAASLLSFDDEIADEQEIALFDFVRTENIDSDFRQNVKNPIILNILEISDLPNVPGDTSASAQNKENFKNATKNTATDQMMDEESFLVQSAEIAQQNEILKSMIVDKNLNTNILSDDITFEEHMKIIGRRFNESNRLKMDEFNNGSMTMKMQQDHRSLDQQINLNLKYGIPLI